MLECRKEKLINIGMHLFFAAVISAAALWGIKRNTTITILIDEFAYWVSAAWLNGRDWSAAMWNCPYYGYGYGFLLAIIMKMFRDPQLMYQMALVLNAGMLVCSYFIAYKCWLELVSDSKRHGMIAAFMAVIYCSNVFYAKMTLAEVFLSFLFWIAVWLSITMNHSRIKQIEFCIILTLLLMTHNRTMGIVAAFVLCIIACGGYTESRSKKVKLVCMALLGIFLFYVGKKYYKSVIYATTVSDIVNINDTSGQISKVMSMFKWEGLESFLLSFLGKSYYVWISSFLLLGYGCIYAGRKIICNFRNGDRTEAFPYCFSLISFWAVLGIAALYFTGVWQYRTDTLIYGRYHECFMGPLILFGIGEIFYQNKIEKETTYIILLGIILTLVTVRYIPLDQTNTNLGITCVGIADLFYKSFSPVTTIYISLLRGIGICLLMLIFKRVKKYKKWLLSCGFAVIASCWIYIALFDADERLYQWTEGTVSSNETLLKDIEKQSGKLTKLYFYQLKDYNANVPYLQFIRPEAKIIYIEDAAALKKLEKGTVIFINSENNLGNIFADEQKYELVSSNYYFEAWRKNE